MGCTVEGDNVEKIKKIPVIGYIFRLIYAIVKLPMHVDQMYEQNRENAKKQAELQNECIRLQDNIELLKSQKADLQESLKEAWNGIQQLQTQNAEQQQLLNEVQQSLNQERQEIHVLRELEMDGQYFEKLRLLLSIHPVLWGDKEKLHISELATMASCFFNTNSGNITIGDYTFAGSGVSILAGSHDQHLKGLLRRDVEITEGCDINIGKGVWLASNSTILGPATIGNNAVVAAGAVVVPGTVIPENTIYAGVPAKCIGKLELEDAQDTTNPAILKALERNHGVLYVEGWTEKKERRIDGTLYRGHEQVKENAVIYTKNLSYKAFYECDKETTLYYKVDNGKMQEISMKDRQGTIDIVLDEEERLNEKIYVIEFIADTSSGLFLGAQVEE